MNTQVQRVLAIDPGREKCGIAVYDQQQGVMKQAIVTAENENKAKTALKRELKKMKLSPENLECKEINTKTQNVDILLDGDY